MKKTFLTIASIFAQRRFAYINIFSLLHVAHLTYINSQYSAWQILDFCVHNISISNTFTIYMIFLHGRNISDLLSRKCSFNSVCMFQLKIFSIILKCAMKLEVATFYLLKSTCQYIAHWIYIWFSPTPLILHKYFFWNAWHFHDWSFF